MGQKQPPRFLDKARDYLSWKGLNSMEFRFLLYFWRVLVVVMAVCYLGSFTPEAWRWAETKYVQTQDIERLPGLLEDAARTKDANKVEKWMRMRPNRDSAILLKQAEPYIGLFSPIAFMDFARRADYLKDEDSRKFWVVYTHYRLRYDALRCGVSDSVELIDKLIRLVARQNSRLLRDIKDDEVIKYAHRVLEEDTKYPAMNDPTAVCNIVAGVTEYKPVPLTYEEWNEVRFNLRFLTDASLKKAEEKKAAEKPQP